MPDAVNSGQYGIGIVIDFFGLSAKASGFPVEFVYPTVTTIVPANVGIIAKARSQKAAEAFVEFLLSDEGQQILLDPKIQRLPVRLATYDRAPAGYPNPFKDTRLGAKVSFNPELSEGRYELLNSLYDRAVTFRLKELNAAWKAIHDAEGKLGARAGAEAKRLIAEARKLAGSVPVSEQEASDKAIAGAFQEIKPGAKPAGRQAEFESRWDTAVVKNYADAKALAEKALTAKGLSPPDMRDIITPGGFPNDDKPSRFAVARGPLRREPAADRRARGHRGVPAGVSGRPAAARDRRRLHGT